MIFNWYKNSENIHTLHKLKDEDKRDRASYFIQELHYLRYLISQGYSKEDCFDLWKSITNGSSINFEYDSEEQEKIFKEQYDKALSMKDLVEYKTTCNIYQQEIDFLNNLEAPYWVRQFWLGMLVWYKCMKQSYIYPKRSLKWEGWILSQAKGHFEYKRKSSVINFWNRKCIRPIEKYVFKDGVYINIPWIVDKGTIVAEDISLENFSELFEFLKDKTFSCVSCGEFYDSDFITRIKENICERCYPHYRRENKTKSMQLSRKIAKKSI